MAGIAATFGAPESALHALSTALARRGAEPATWRAGATRLLVRASMPAVHEHRGVALALDGIAEVSALAAGYASRGTAGLVAGAEPYALILADPARGALVLARNGDGPPLYYAETASGVLAA